MVKYSHLNCMSRLTRCINQEIVLPSLCGLDVSVLLFARNIPHIYGEFF